MLNKIYRRAPGSRRVEEIDHEIDVGPDRLSDRGGGDLLVGRSMAKAVALEGFRIAPWCGIWLAPGLDGGRLGFTVLGQDYVVLSYGEPSRLWEVLYHELFHNLEFHFEGGELGAVRDLARRGPHVSGAYGSSDEERAARLFAAWAIVHRDSGGSLRCVSGATEADEAQRIFVEFFDGEIAAEWWRQRAAASRPTPAPGSLAGIMRAVRLGLRR